MHYVIGLIMIDSRHKAATLAWFTHSVVGISVYLVGLYSKTYTVPIKSLDTLSHSSQWEGVSESSTGTVL